MKEKNLEADAAIATFVLIFLHCMYPFPIKLPG
jgi:hypothetical protein